jgi:hypothetical protein
MKSAQVRLLLSLGWWQGIKRAAVFLAFLVGPLFSPLPSDHPHPHPTVITPAHHLSMFSCCNKIPHAGKLLNGRNLFLTVLDNGNSKVKVPTELVRDEGCFLVHGMLTSCHALTR